LSQGLSTVTLCAHGLEDLPYISDADSAQTLRLAEDRWSAAKDHVSLERLCVTRIPTPRTLRARQTVLAATPW